MYHVFMCWGFSSMCCCCIFTIPSAAALQETAESDAWCKVRPCGPGGAGELDEYMVNEWVNEWLMNS